MLARTRLTAAAKWNQNGSILDEASHAHDTDTEEHP